MSNEIKLSGTKLNAPDALELARFYAEITGGEASGFPQWAVAIGPNGSLEFQQVTDFCAPDWPSGPTPMHMHLDFLVDDLEAAGERVVAAGARRADFQPNAEHCVVYADPVGHLFCLSTWDLGQSSD